MTVELAPDLDPKKFYTRALILSGIGRFWTDLKL
jgi:hypothetical protein